MEGPLRYRSFSIIANLSELESFILHDPTSQSLYYQYLALTNGRKANHIPFFADIVGVSERMNFPQYPSMEALRAELYILYEKYFVEDGEFYLDITEDKVHQVRRNIQKNVSLIAFKPAIKAVVRDLAFIYLDSFMSSEIFKDFKENVLVDFELTDVLQTTKERDSVMKLKRFFGDKLVPIKTTGKSVGDQPQHIKEYKLSKIFGERVGVEKMALLEPEGDIEQVPELSAAKRRDRKLHVFFGDYFEIEETLYSERVRSQSICTVDSYRKQPNHVKSFRLARFFGQRPPSRKDLYAASKDDHESSSSSSGSEVETDFENENEIMDKREIKKEGLGMDDEHARHKKQHLSRFFGERMDPEKEATSVSFANQPSNVKACTLMKIFGESAAQSIRFGGDTYPPCRSSKSRTKLEKFFGPFEA